MKVSIFGMGYVGVVSGACLLRDGHEIVGIDPVDAKVADLCRGRSPVQEPGVAELLTAGHQAGRLHATANPVEGLAGSHMAWVCVGTPSDFDGGINLAAVETVIGQIVPAEGSSSHSAPRLAQVRQNSHAGRNHREQRCANRQRSSAHLRAAAPHRRDGRAGVQGGYRRHAREPLRQDRQGPDRGGHPAADLRPGNPAESPDRQQQGAGAEVR